MEFRIEPLEGKLVNLEELRKYYFIKKKGNKYHWETRIPFFDKAGFIVGGVEIHFDIKPLNNKVGKITKAIGKWDARKFKDDAYLVWFLGDEAQHLIELFEYKG